MYVAKLANDWNGESGGTMNEKILSIFDNNEQ